MPVQLLYLIVPGDSKVNKCNNKNIHRKSFRRFLMPQILEARSLFKLKNGNLKKNIYYIYTKGLNDKRKGRIIKFNF